nr:hypothetical protein [Tanacetum cinerariifolium]
MLYAPPSPPDQNNQFDDQTLNLAREIVNSNHHPINTDELKEEEDHDDEGELGGFEKLTRAQRKRLRKQKLKEAASHRREIIGPQLPGKGDDDQQAEGVRQNAAERVESGNELHRGGESPSCIKVKHRRTSKKKAIEKQKAYLTDLSHDTPHPGDKSLAFSRESILSAMADSEIQILL